MALKFPELPEWAIIECRYTDIPRQKRRIVEQMDNAGNIFRQEIDLVNESTQHTQNFVESGDLKRQNGWSFPNYLHISRRIDVGHGIEDWETINREE